MSPGILLTQYSAAADAAARAAVRLAAAAGLQATVPYRQLDNPAAGALLQYIEQPKAAILPPADAAARYLCRQTQDSGANAEPARVLMIIAFCVPDARCAEVDRWYIEEHAPLLLRAPGWLRMRRYEPLSWHGARWTHLAVHELRNVAVLDSAERAFARSTPWRARLEQEAWFPQAGRWVYERIDTPST